MTSFFAKRTCLCVLLSLLLCVMTQAQRPTDRLGRGLVASKVDNGVYLSWRILAEEYYDTKYNVYRNGTKLNSQPLSVSNFTDADGSASNTYTVSAVVRGVEQSQCKAVNVWNGYKYKQYTTCESGYFDIPLAKVYDYNGNDVTNTYIANDCEVADLDGDGEMEIIVKRRSTKDDADLYVSRTDGAYDRIDAYKLDGTLLWWIDAGPNMVSGGSHELNIIAYDWDGDGAAEVLLRGGDNMMVHGQRGSSRQEWPQRIGRNGVDTRGSITHKANMTYTNTGDEFLVYMDGDHGIIYDAVRYMSYPLTRGSASDWGDSYGHRSSKYFFGAPFLDGKNPSIFLARGIYTKHKMAAYDVDPSTHSLTQRWYWEGNSSPYFGQGNHNYSIADVDMDGRDEIIYGSMVIDDNGKGLHTTGLGHGDALHVGDLDPFRHGLEIFACNEEKPAMNYRNGTTGKIYFRHTSSSDDGRALCANFTDRYPGSIGRSTQTGMVSTVADQVISELGDFIAWSDLNFRIYYDGDLLSEVFNSPGTEREAAIIKPGSGRLFTSSGCKTNNWSKNHPCFSGDILGDWREEIIMRVGEGHDYIRIYTTCMPTSYPIYSLWFDHQYRQAMVWQMHAYNQPPHPSFFLGELEDLTVPPPPLTLTGRTQIASGTTIGNGYNNQHLLLHENANTTLNVTNGASPYILTINVPTWVQGTNSTSTTNPTINRTTYTCNLNGGALTGGMRLVKQGDGILTMATVDHTYTGETQIWEGTVNFDGSLRNSSTTLHRFTTLNSKGSFRSITMEYAASLHPGGDGTVATITVDSLNLKYGARVVIDFNGILADQVNTRFISIGTKDWEYGPTYNAPVFQFLNASSLANGTYAIGTCETVAGELSNITLEGLNKDAHLKVIEGTLYLVVGSLSSNTDDEGNALCSKVGSGTFYFRHLATGKFLTGDNNWGTRSSISVAATPVTLAPSGTGYTIDTNISNGGDSHYLGSDYFMDGLAIAWSFVETTNANGQTAYLITADGTNYLCCEGATTVVNTTTNRNNPNALWTLHTKNALVEELAGAITERDATFLIAGADMSRNHGSNNSWTGSPTIEGLNENFNGEKFNCTFDVNQTLTGIPNGVYVLSCQGFYRDGGYNDAATLRSRGNEALNAMLYANGATAPLPSIFEEAGKNGTVGVNTTFGYIPDGQADASSYFNAGLYPGTSVTVTVTDGTLKIGVKKTTAVTNDWTVFDRFRLTYQGPAETLIATNYVRNGDFESNSFAGWETTMQPRNNQLTTNTSTYQGFTNHAWENWKGVAMTGTMHQTITGLPSGTYKLAISAHVNELGSDEQQFIYANDDEVYLNVNSGAYETYVYVNNGVLEIGLNQISPIANWLALDNVTLYYVSESPVVANYNDALARANRVYAKASTVYANVTGDELTALQQALNNYANTPSNATLLKKAIADLNTATNAFVAAKESYDNYYAVATVIEALGIEESAWPYADVSLKSAYEEAMNAVPQNASAAKVMTESLYTAVRAYVESNATVVRYDGEDYTSYITNAEGTSTDGWTSSSSCWTLNNEPYTDAEGGNNHSYIDVNSVTSFTLSQQLSNLPQGYYVLTTTARAQTGISHYQLFAENAQGARTSQNIPVMGNSGGLFGRGWNDAFLTFVQPNNGSATIGVEASNNTNFWMSAARFRLYRLEATGDVNNDGKVNILDLTIAINKLLGEEPLVFNAINADLNYSGNHSLVDITELINKILSQPAE